MYLNKIHYSTAIVGKSKHNTNSCMSIETTLCKKKGIVKKTSRDKESNMVSHYLQVPGNIIQL